MRKPYQPTLRMDPKTYADAAVEVLTIIENSAKDVKQRIPVAFIEKLRAISEKSSHTVTLDRTKSLAEQGLMNETRKIIQMIYATYLETEEERQKSFEAQVERFRANKLSMYQSLASAEDEE